MIDAPDLRGVKPEDAIQEALENALTGMRTARSELAAIEAGEHWTVIEYPNVAKSALHKAIAWEQKERESVAYIAARMMDLNIEGRKASAAEVLAEAIAPALGAIFEGLKLTAAQKKRAPELVQRHLSALETTGQEVA